jgi:regulator of protease activity HflC (stomatin/prohibitin superfamily)
MTMLPTPAPQMNRTQERPASRIPGFGSLFVGLAALAGGLYLFIQGASRDQGGMILLGLLIITAGIVLMVGLFVVQPNEARVLTLFGRYSGTVRDDGFWWVNPFTIKKSVSLKVRNFQADKLKVNDNQGNPIEIAAVVVWRVVDSAKALFDVEKYEEFVKIQAETSIRTIATRYPYDAQDDTHSLRGHPDEVADNLRAELHARLENAGVEVMETRISHLAYAPEIAQAMLRRQQAAAVISARQMIVEGAVGMVEIALKRLESENVVSLDEEKKAAMVNNLLVALVSESNAQPIINAGTLY